MPLLAEDRKRSLSLEGQRPYFDRTRLASTKNSKELKAKAMSIKHSNTFSERGRTTE